MLNTLASHNNDIRRLLEKGYAISLDSNYLVIRDIPYLDQNEGLQTGAIISKLVFDDNDHVRLEDHQVFFCGSHPHEIGGKSIVNLGGGVVTLTLASDDLIVQRSFSNKPVEGFRDLFEKVESYVTIISGPAIDKYGANPYTFGTREDVSTSVFKVRDTLTSRAEIGDLSRLFQNEVVAIIGLGGTGAYLLDLIAKTPVKEIKGFDNDWFQAHTAFRSPGKLEHEENSELGKRKAEVYQGRYEKFREGIQMHSKHILRDSDEDMQGVTFAFVCIDSGSARKDIIDLLVRLKIPFIDVGMGLARQNGPISGMVRTTFFPTEAASEILEKGYAPMSDISDEVYKTNIQIAELNALNACLAVIKYKQLCGFYTDHAGINHLLFNMDCLNLVGI